MGGILTGLVCINGSTLTEYDVEIIMFDMNNNYYWYGEDIFGMRGCENG
jgi:hypothetical protein